MNLTGRPTLQKPKRKAKAKGLRPVSRKRAAYRASQEGQRAAEHMRRVKELPCVICRKPGPSDVHHCKSGRFSARKAGDFDVIPLCVEHHRYPHPDAYHSGQETWERKWGLDTDYLPEVCEMLKRRET